VVQDNAMKAWETGEQLRDLLAADSRVGLSESELDECFDPVRFLANTGVVFDRLMALEIG
jgi:adenylosuccinate lyase